MKTLNIIIRDLREDHDLKQKTLANYLGVVQQTYSHYENARREIPVSVVRRLAKYYHVSTDYLLRPDTGYPGNLNLNAIYTDGVSMHDLLYDMQAFDKKERSHLIKYVQSLKQKKRKGQIPRLG